MRKYKTNIICSIIMIVLIAMSSFTRTQNEEILIMQKQFSNNIGKKLESNFFPQIYCTATDTDGNNGIASYMIKEILGMMPMLNVYYANASKIELGELGNEYSMYNENLNGESHYENFLDAEGNLVVEESSILSTTMAEDMNVLKDPANLISKYYIVDRTASVDTSLFSAEAFMEKDMKLAKDVDGPQILIYHTHSQEAFTDSIAGDSSTTIVGVGEYLTELLEEAGIEVLHHEGVYDLIDGKLDRSKAYEYALGNVQKILEENPSIELVIDDCVIIGQI